MIQEGMAKIWSFVLDCVFPQSCLGCGDAEVFLCADCKKNSTDLNKAKGIFRCPSCGTDSSQGIVCTECETKSSIDQIIALVQYQPGVLPAELIEYLKYHYAKDAFLEIKEWLKSNQEILGLLSEVDMVIPLPLHPRRLAERGFNQAESIARIVAQIMTKPTNTTSLKRIRATKQQATLNRVERITNVANAFVCLQPAHVKDKTILLIDDVYTTGSTMQAAAMALKKAGAKKVRGFTLARGLCSV